MIDDNQAEQLDFKGRVGVWCYFRDRSGREEVLAEIRTKLAEYDDPVFRLQKKNAMKRPTGATRSPLWLVLMKRRVMEADWTVQTDDLVALADDADEQTWFHFVIHYARNHAPRLIRVRLKDSLITGPM